MNETAEAWGARGLTVRFGRHTVLETVDLEIPAGAVTCVIGGDGSGKTTLLRALAGVVRPASGSVRRPERRRIGYVAGAGAVYGDLSVAENIAFVGGVYGLRGAALAQRARTLLAETRLEGTGERLAARLSGGMRQKLAFALAMLHEPDLLILDEPTTGVDPVSRAELWRLIAGAAAAGAGVLVTTTYLDEADRASSVTVLDGGRVVAAGAPAEVAAAFPAPARAPGGRACTPTAGRDPSAATSGAAAPAGATGGAEDTNVLAAARGAVRRFGGLVAVDGVDLTVRRGEVVGLVGANGAGKTTLIRMLLGLLRPTAGEVALFGGRPTRATRRRLGYVPQSLGLWDDLTVAENLAFRAGAFGCPAPALEPDLAAASGTLVHRLPLGLRRRIAFAAALAHRPELLILDEPTSGVDPAARARLWGTIHGVAGDGAGILVTTHHMAEVSECDRVLVMVDGRTAAEGPAADLVRGRAAVTVDAERWEAAFTALTAAGLPPAVMGRTLRVAGGDAAAVSAALAAAHVDARLSTAPATFEETFVLLAEGRAAVAEGAR